MAKATLSLSSCTAVEPGKSPDHRQPVPGLKAPSTIFMGHQVSQRSPPLATADRSHAVGEGPVTSHLLRDGAPSFQWLTSY